MAKRRTTIPEDVASRVRWLSDDTCCICNERKKGIQLHHIDEDPQNHSAENLAVLCLECHNETQKSGGFTRGLNSSYVTECRNKWNKTVCLIREDVYKISVERQVEEKSSGDQPKDKRQSRWNDKRQRTLDYLQAYSFPYIYVKSLPKFKSDLLQQLKKQVSGGTTPDIVNAYSDYADALISILVTLADFYHPEHFEDLSPKEFFLKTVSERNQFYLMVSHQFGMRNSGTIGRIYQAHLRVKDIENLIVTMVGGLMYPKGSYDDIDYDDWQQLWRDSEILQ